MVKRSLSDSIRKLHQKFCRKKNEKQQIYGGFFQWYGWCGIHPFFFTWECRGAKIVLLMQILQLRSKADKRMSILEWITCMKNIMFDVLKGQIHVKYMYINLFCIYIICEYTIYIYICMYIQYIYTSIHGKEIMSHKCPAWYIS